MTGLDLLVDSMDTTGAAPFPNLTSEIGRLFASAYTTGLSDPVRRHTSDASCAFSFVSQLDHIDYNATLASKLRELFERSQLLLGGFSSTDIPIDLQIRRLIARVGCADEERLEQFLRARVHLIHLVDEALRRIRNHFPHETMRLSVEDDPDTPATEYLVCFIRTQQTVEEAEVAYDKFRDEWWLDAKQLADGCFTICVEYQ